MRHIFISYSSRHRSLTEDFAARLEVAGWPVWWDHALEAYGEYEAQIRQAIDDAGAFVVIWSEGAAQSKFVHVEVHRALRQGKPVNLRAPEFPIDDVPLDFQLEHTPALNLSDLSAILGTVETVWQGRVPEGVTPFHETHRERYVDLFDPKMRPRPTTFAELTPSALLQAKYAIVPYIDATGTLADMLAWCHGEGHDAEAPKVSAGRLLHGPRGLGKTRTMIEVVGRLPEAGWLAGFKPPLDPDAPEAERHHRRLTFKQVVSHGPEPGVLIVMDYAESRSADVIALSRLASKRPREGVRPIRLVLLSRGEAWWQDVYRAEPEGAGALQPPRRRAPFHQRRGGQRGGDREPCRRRAGAHRGLAGGSGARRPCRGPRPPTSGSTPLPRPSMAIRRPAWPPRG